MTDTRLVGIVLLAVIPLFAIESVGYRRGRIDSAFFRMSMGEKLDHLADHIRDWWLVTIGSVITLIVTVAGMAGVAGLLADAGEGAVAWMSFSVVALSGMGMLVATAMGGAGLTVASQQRTESGVTPTWVDPIWQSLYVLEGIWVIGANLAYIGFGIAILATDIVGAWAGWAAIGTGAVIVAAVAILRDGFPQLSLLVPLVLGVAFVLA